MEPADSLNHAREVLAGAVRDRGAALPRPEPLALNPYLAMSQLQKAIPRDRPELALANAARLLEISPERLWRRLAVTAFEDVGVADLEAVALTLAGLTGKSWRSRHGGDWAIAGTLVERLCRATKCRAADDLVYVCERHPSLQDARSALLREPVERLLDRAGSRAAMPERALALWYAVGTQRCQADNLPLRRGDPQGVFQGLGDRGVPADVIELAREGLKKDAGILAPFVLLLAREARRSVRLSQSDDLPEEVMIGPVPGWAYDMHTREGKQALARLLQGDGAFARWARAHLPRSRRLDAPGDLLFWVESGLVARRLRWETGDRLRRMAEREGLGLDPAEAARGLALLRRDLPLLHQARRRVAGSNIR